MPLRSPEYETVARSIYELHKDLNKFTNDNVLRGDLDSYINGCLSSKLSNNTRFCNYIDFAFEGANSVLRNYRRSRSVPRTLLAASAVTAARNVLTPPLRNRGARMCYAAELKLFHSLSLNAQDTGPSKGVPAAVFFDVNHLPFAYSKSVGTIAALAWRNALFETSSGLVEIPSGMFFNVGYGENGSDDIQNKSIRSGVISPLISTEGLAPPANVRLIRLSAFLLSRELAFHTYNYETNPSSRYSYLDAYIPMALDTALDGIGNQVHALISQGHIDTVGPSLIAA